MGREILADLSLWWAAFVRPIVLPVLVYEIEAPDHCRRRQGENPISTAALMLETGINLISMTFGSETLQCAY
jgi:hypothetical protein